MLIPSSLVLFGTFLGLLALASANVPCNSTTPSCENGQLVEHPPQLGYFEITTTPNQQPQLSNKSVNACGQRFNVGGSTCEYCPTQVGSTCSTFSNTTIITGNGGMGSIVPGGQRYYIEQATGALGFTQAHSASLPSGGAIQGGFSARENGLFQYVGQGAGWWLACPQTFGTQTAWQVYQRLEGLSFTANCFPIEILVGARTNGHGAWQYT
ncbi:MAG: hypothetical protein M1831_002164 [Alyxoria varia]|nr:MAG: hypothetical protein M1831_002164 [Alyxoria varia]